MTTETHIDVPSPVKSDWRQAVWDLNTAALQRTGEQPPRPVETFDPADVEYL